MIEMKVKFFFDRKAVIDAVGRARAKVLSAAGSFIRRTARTRVRYRKRISSPGESPSTHNRDDSASLRNIQYSYDPSRKSVVIGPVKISKASANFTPSGTVPQVLEFGGRVSIRETMVKGRWRAGSAAGGGPTRLRTASIERRPFMGPALQENLPKFPELWRDSVVRSGN